MIDSLEQAFCNISLVIGSIFCFDYSYAFQTSSDPFLLVLYPNVKNHHFLNY